MCHVVGINKKNPAKAGFFLLILLAVSRNTTFYSNRITSTIRIAMRDITGDSVASCRDVYIFRYVMTATVSSYGEFFRRATLIIVSNLIWNTANISTS